MRLILLLTLIACVACRPIYSRDVSNWSAYPETIPEVGTPYGDLETWFHKRGFAAGPDVFQSEAELLRMQGSPPVYSVEVDRSWWFSRVRAVQDYCVTQKFIYYKLDEAQRLSQAIQNSRSSC